MPRLHRRALVAPFFHVTNRSVRREALFLKPLDYRAFLSALAEGLERHPVKLLAYCLMPNHWHLVLEPRGTGMLSSFMQWVTSTHAARWNRHRKTTGQGPVYQGRFFSRPVDFSADLVRVCRYVERNALKARLVARAQDWPWGSLAERFHPEPRVPLRHAAFLLSPSWVEYVNADGSLEEQIDELVLARMLEPGPARGDRPSSSGT
jgi:putative transposase